MNDSHAAFDGGENGEVRTWVMPQTRMNSLKSQAMNCGPLSEMMRGPAWGNFSRARAKMISTFASFIDSRSSPGTRGGNEEGNGVGGDCFSSSGNLGRIPSKHNGRSLVLEGSYDS